MSPDGARTLGIPSLKGKKTNPLRRFQRLMMLIQEI